MPWATGYAIRVLLPVLEREPYDGNNGFCFLLVTLYEQLVGYAGKAALKRRAISFQDGAVLRIWDHGFASTCRRRTCTSLVLLGSPGFGVSNDMW